MARKEIAVKKYAVTLSNEEREHLTALIRSGHHPAQKLLKARILLKADASDGGEGWSDSQIAAALESSVDTVAPAAGRRRGRGRPDSQAFTKFSEAAHLRRGGRGQVDRVGLFQAAGRPGTLDIATAGRGGRRTKDRQTRQR